MPKKITVTEGEFAGWQTYDLHDTFDVVVGPFYGKLDPNGHIASCNATNFFWVTDGALCTSSGEYCFNGITRANVLALARANGIAVQKGDFPPDALDGASEAFVTGTFGGLTPVAAIDGRRLGALPGPLTARLIALYDGLKDSDA